MKASRLFLLILVVVPLSATADTYKIDSAHSRIAFMVHQFVSSVRGEFHRFSGTIEVDREHPEHSSVMARISLASIDTKIQKRDRHLLSSEFFDAAKFPEIAFRSRSVKRTGQNSGDITGEIGNAAERRLASGAHPLDRYHRPNSSPRFQRKV